MFLDESVTHVLISGNGRFPYPLVNMYTVIYIEDSREYYSKKN